MGRLLAARPPLARSTDRHGRQLRPRGAVRRAVSAIFWPRSAFGERGLLLAALSGSVASGLGYAAWYTALPRLGAITAANLQLSVPVIASLAGVALFGEPVTSASCRRDGVAARGHHARHAPRHSLRG